MAETFSDGFEDFPLSDRVLLYGFLNILGIGLFVESVAGLNYPDALPIENPLRNLAALRDVFQQIVEALVTNPLDVGSTVRPELAE